MRYRKRNWNRVQKSLIAYQKVKGIREVMRKANPIRDYLSLPVIRLSGEFYVKKPVEDLSGVFEDIDSMVDRMENKYNGGLP